MAVPTVRDRRVSGGWVQEAGVLRGSGSLLVSCCESDEGKVRGLACLPASSPLEAYIPHFFPALLAALRIFAIASLSCISTISQSRSFKKSYTGAHSFRTRGAEKSSQCIKSSQFCGKKAVFSNKEASQRSEIFSGGHCDRTRRSSNLPLMASCYFANECERQKSGLP